MEDKKKPENEEADDENVIIKKLKVINRRVIDRSSLSKVSIVF